MAKWIKYIFITLSIVLVILGTILILVYQNLDQLKQYALKEVNKSLTCELSAKKIDVSILGSFPKVSLVFYSAKITDPLRSGKNLLTAKKLFLGFDVMDIINKNYQIHQIEMDSANADLFIDKMGQSNFDIVRPDSIPSKNKQKHFSFKLDHLIISNSKISFNNFIQQFALEGSINKATFSGKFSDIKFELTTEVDGHLMTLNSGDVQLIKDKQLLLETSLLVDMKKQSIALNKSNLKIDELAIALLGGVSKSTHGTDYNLSFSAAKISIQDLLSILPFQLPKEVKEYQSNGLVFFKGEIKGLQNGTKMPNIEINFGIDKGSLLDPTTKLKLEDIKLKGKFTNGEACTLASSLLSLSELEASLKNQKVHGSLSISNFESPQLDADLNGRVDTKVLNNFLGSSPIKDIVGDISFSVSLKAKRHDNAWDWSSPFNSGKFKGELGFIKLTNIDKTLEQVQFDLELTPHQLDVHNLSLKVGKSDFAISGTIPSFLANLTATHPNTHPNLSINSNLIDMDDLLIYTPNKSVENLKDSKEPITFTLDAKVVANEFFYNKFHANKLKTNLSYTTAGVKFNDLQFASCGGKALANGEFLFEPTQYKLVAKLNLKDIILKEMLNEFENFGQNEFTAKNINGILNTETEFVLVWDQEFGFKKEKLLVISDLAIKNGELLNYEPLNSLSKFVDVNELKNLKFSELKNSITISNGILTIPNMDVRNNALNLNLMGTHSLENIVDYKVKLSITELLKKKRKPKPNEFEEEDEKSKGLNLFISIKGPLDKLKYTYDRPAVQAKIKQDAKVEKENIKEILRQEFSIKRDTSFKKMEKKNEKNDELEFEDN